MAMCADFRFKAVILAAGSSLRMGTPKQLLKVQGSTMLDHAIRAALGAGLDPPVVVLGAHREMILEGIKLAGSCEIVINRQYGLGQASSLVAGVQHIMGSCDAAVFLLADQPFVGAKLIAAMMGRFCESEADLLYPTYKKQRGNPVIIGKHLFPRLLTANGDAGARFLFNDKTLNILAYTTKDKSVIVDIDTPEDFQAHK
ncbi:MAG: nucleotidyltransferase family protein [Desulforhopalus sp.]